MADIVAFPDISGLRATAPSRKNKDNKAQPDIVQSLDTKLSLSDPLVVVQGSKTPDVLQALRLAWAITLYHTQSHEASAFAFTQLAPSSQSSQDDLQRTPLRFEVDRENPSALSLEELDGSLLNSAQKDQSASSEAGDTAVIDLTQGSFKLPHLGYAVLLIARSNDGHLQLEIHASAAVHSDESAQFQLRQLETLLNSFRPGSDTSELPALSAKRFPTDFLAIDNPNLQILEEDIGPLGLKEERLEFQFERRVQEHPDEPALDFRYHIDGHRDVPEENVLLSYKQLDEFANAIAHALADLGAVRDRDALGGDDHIVALFLPKSPETFISILGVCKANASWCPLDVEWPIERQAALFKKCKAKYIITSTDVDDEKLKRMELGDDITILRADRVVAEAKRDATRLRPLEIRRSAADQLAYLVWTSGTTGLPKAVGIQHSAVVQAIRALQTVVPHDPPVRYLQFSEYTFDLSIMDEFWTWGLGGTVCSGSRALHLDSLTAIGNATGTTHVILTPAVSAEIRREDVPSMKVLINGGEKLSQVVADAWSKDCCLLNLYGPAEATLIAMNRRVPQGDVFKAPNIGVALPTTSLALIDRHGDVVPRGAIGELTIGGPQCARGYVGDPAKTAEKFIDHPQLGRVYRTGDLTRQLWSGEIEYLGREDDQVKINGVRIELLEINAAIKDCHDAVKDSDTMALPRPNNPESLQIVNFSVVPTRADEGGKKEMIRTDKEATAIAHALRAAALLRLPSNMVPTHFLILSRFPKTSSAKIDRVAIKKALADFDYMRWESKIAASEGGDDDEGGEEDGGDGDDVDEEAVLAALASAVSSVYGVQADSAKAQELVKQLAKSKLQVGSLGVSRGSKKSDSGASASAAETLVRRLLAEVCGIEATTIGRNTPLPALGLTSFKAMSLTRKLMDEGVRCSVLSIIQHNTLAKLSNFIQANSSGNLAAASDKKTDDSKSQGSSQKKKRDNSTINNDVTPPSSSPTNKVLQQFSDLYRAGVSRHLRLKADDVLAVHPCAPLQEGMLAETQRQRDAYWAFRKYELRQPPGDASGSGSSGGGGAAIDAAKVVEAVRGLVERVDVFRTGFLEVSEIDVGDGGGEGAEAEAARREVLPFQPNFVQVVTKRSDALVEQLEVPEDADFDSFVQEKASKSFSRNALSGRTPLAFWVTRQGAVHHLVIHAHHAIYDGLTLSIMQEIIRQIYSGQEVTVPFHQFEAGLPAMLMLTEKERDQQQQTWKKALSGYARTPETRFPDIRDVRDLSNSTSLVTATQSAATTWSLLEKAALQHECSPRIIAQIAWARLLALYSEQDDVLIGDTVWGRDKDPVLGDVMGPVITTVPVPFSFGKGKTFASIIERTRRFHDEVQSYQHAPLGLVRSELQIPPDRAVMGALFVFNSAPAEQATDDALSFGAPLDFGAAVEHDVALQLNLGSDESLEIEISTMRTRMSLAQLDVLAKQYDVVLSAICEDAEADSSAIESSFPHSLRSVGAVTPWALAENQTGKNSAVWLSHWAQQRPDAPALEFHHDIEGQSKPTVLSYSDLDRASSQLAAHLHKKIGTQKIVAVSLARQPATYVALLAILRSSNVYVPIDEALPAERKQLLLRDSGAAFLIVDEQSAETFADFDAKLVIAQGQSDWDKLDGDVASLPAPTDNADDLAFCLYTSGSTGKPKGCLLTTGNLSTAIEAFLDVIESKAPRSFEDSARYLARSAEAFDVHLKEVLLPLRTGSTILTAPREVILQDLGAAMKALRPTHAAVVPSLFFSAGRRVQPADLPSLRVLIVGGEKVANDIIATWGAQDKVVVLNAYGPTEVTIGISIAQIRENSLASNVGKAFPGSQYWVMRRDGNDIQPVLRGQVGELYVSGPQVGRGYLGQDSDAFFTWQGERIYRTGDLARMSVNDEVHYIGRADGSQVKIRGARLELSEVDAKLQDLIGDQSIATTVLTTHPELKDDHLVSFVQKNGATTREEQAKIDESDFELTRQLATKARQALPAHMAPFLIIPVQAMPLAVISGKANGKALIALYQGSTLADLREKLAPTSRREFNKTEAVIAEETKKTLGVEFELNPASNLFEAGMDSLSAIRLSSRLRKKGLQISVATLMTGATIEAIAATLENTGANASSQRSEEEFEQACAKLSAQLDDEIRSKSEHVLPCMPLQSSLISLSRVRPEEQLYVGKFELALNKDTDLEKLKSAVIDSLRAHEIYRTIFPTAGKALAQVVLRGFATDYLWATEDAKDEAGQADRRNAIGTELIAQIAEKPPVRAAHFPSQNKLVLLVHHAIYDGESVGNLLQEISERYRGRDVETGVQFRQVVQSWWRSEPSGAEEFWKEQLDGFVFTPFPNLNGVRKTGPSQRKEVQLKSSVSFDAVKKVAQQHAVSPQSLVLTLFSRLLSLYTGEEDVLFGLVLRGRSFDVTLIENVHGPCVTTVPFFIKSAKATEQLYKDVQTKTSEILPYQHQPLSKIAQAVQVQGSLFNTLFAFTNRDSGHLAFCSEPDVTMDAEFDLAVEVEAVPSSGEVSFLATFRDSLLGNEQADILLKSLETLLQEAVSSSSQRQIPKEILSISNDPPRDLAGPEDGFIPRFIQHAQKDQKKVAFVFGNTFDELQSVTYGALDADSTTLAQRLLKTSATIIAVYLHKSIDFYNVLLAVWKAGKTYLPVDPALPAERIKYMLETASDVTVLTTSELRSSLPEQSKDIIVLEDLKQSSATDAQLPPLSLESAAYLLFTSGSTGRPKGCLVSHRALAAALLSWDSIIPLSTSSRMLQLASIGFDVSLIEVCMPLSRGASFASAPKEVLLEDLEDTFFKLNITCADLPAALASSMRQSKLPKLEWIMTGGDMMSEETLKEWAPKGKLINAWGPTETTIGNTLGFVAENATRNNIGKAYPCSSIFILDSKRQPVFRGGIGEIAVGGPQVGDGYIGQPQLTAERFITLASGQKVYLTGDRGRLLYDDSVEFLGRAEQGQVKVNGQRIELDEISSAFARSPSLNEAETLYLQHPSFKSKQLVTFVSIGQPSGNTAQLKSDDSDDAAQAIREALGDARKHLAAYMIPAHVLAVQGRLPMTNNNKTDRKALQSFYESLSSQAIRGFGAKLQAFKEADEQWTPEGERLRQTIAEFCEVPADTITSSTSVYHLGVDSISAMILAKQLGSAGYAITVQDILQSPSIYALSQRVEKDVKSPGQDPVKAAEDLSKKTQSSVDVSDAGIASDALLLPCSPLQSGMLAQFLTSESKAYLHRHGFSTKLPVEEIAAAWKQLVKRTDILRTSFHFLTGKSESNGTWYQAVHSSIEPVVEHDGSRVGAPQQNGFSSALSRDESFLAHCPHKLEIETQQDGSRTVTLVLHHALYDGSSLPLLFQDLDDLTAGKDTTSRPAFSTLLPHLLSTNDDVKFWTQQLEGYESRPVHNAAKEVTASVDAEHTLKIDVATAKSSCQRLGVSLQVIASLAFAKLLASLSGSSDVVFGEIFALRQSLADAEAIIGPAFNTVPVRVTLDDAQRTVAEQVQILQRHNDEGRPHRKASLRGVIASLNRQGLEGNLFDALFDFASQGDSAGDLLNFKPVSDPGATAFGQYSLNIGFVQTPSQLSLNLTVSSDLDRAYPVQTLASRYEDILVQLLQNPDERVLALPGGDELTAWQGTTPKKASPAANGTASGERWKSENEEKVWRAIARAASIDAEELSRATSLASLGLDSISAIGISSSLRKEGIRLSAAQMLRGATLGRILEGLASSNGSQKTKSSKSVEASDDFVSKASVARRLRTEEKNIEQVLPVLAGHAWMLGGWLNSGRREGVFSFPIHVPAQVDVKRLEDGWKQLVARYATLRTTFASVDGRIVQVVLTAEAHPGELEVVEVRQGEDVRSTLARVIKESAQAPKDFFRPPVRVTLARSPSGTSSPEAAIVLQLHHCLYDAVAMKYIIADLGAIYDGKPLAGEPGYGSIANAVGTAVDQLGQTSASSDFWRKALDGAEKTIFKAPSGGTDDGSHPAPILKKARWQGVRKAQAAVNSKRGSDSEPMSLQSLFIAAVGDAIGASRGLQSPTLMMLHAGRTSAAALAESQLGEGADDLNVDRAVGLTAALTPLSVRRGHDGGSARSQGKGLLASAQQLATDLLERVEHEQTWLGDIYSASQHGSGALTNVVLNMGWFSSGGGGRAEATTATSGDDSKTPWTSFKVGEAIDFIAQKAHTRTPHALDDIDDLDNPLVGPLQRLGLDRIDIGVTVGVNLDEGGDAVNVAVLTDQGRMDESGAQELADAIVSRVDAALSSL